MSTAQIPGYEEPVSGEGVVADGAAVSPGLVDTPHIQRALQRQHIAAKKLFKLYWLMTTGTSHHAGSVGEDKRGQFVSVNSPKSPKYRILQQNNSLNSTG